MRQDNFELRLLVGGKPIHEYEHRGNTFVEGRKNSEFELEFKNNTGNRVLAIPSVDGLSVMDGKPATPDSLGYVVGPHATLRIPGWRLDANGIAKFVFQDKEHSYTRQTDSQDSSRAGVIGMLVYAEKVQVDSLPKPYIPPLPQVPKAPYVPPYVPTWPTWPGTFPAQPTWQPYWNMMGDAVCSGAVTQSATQTANMVNTTTAPSTRSTTVQYGNQPPFELGTGFGDKAQFKTNEVTFDRGMQVATLVVYYDSRRNLEKRGIQVLRKSRSYLEDLPSPFQGTGCTPPKDWQG